MIWTLGKNYGQKCLLNISFELKTDQKGSARSLTLVIFAAVWAVCG